MYEILLYNHRRKKLMKMLEEHIEDESQMAKLAEAMPKCMRKRLVLKHYDREDFYCWMLGVLRKGGRYDG
ncbi:MAG: hypothetical protein OXR68_00190 [Alphaproteobacteria bacterium]|nr:hypothetical protein [Alphaproteobacteria bacterium]